MCQGAELEKWACIFPSSLRCRTSKTDWAGVARELGTGTNTNRACLLHLGHTIQCSEGPAVLWPPEVELVRKICLWG